MAAPASPGARAITLAPSSSLDDLAFPAKDPLDILPGTIDMGPFLGSLGLTIAGAPILSVDPALTAVIVAVTPTVITIQIGGGASTAAMAGPSTQSAPAVALLVPLSFGNQIEIVVAQPIQARAPSGLVPAPLPANDAYPALIAAAF